MRPWMAACRASAAPATSSFNGATALRPWMAAGPGGKRSRPSCFNGATALRPWMERPRIVACTARAGFNGATALRPWMVTRAQNWACCALGLQWGHGLAAVDGVKVPLARLPALSFNGATALRPWMAHDNGVGLNGRRGFNGATALRPWMARPNRRDRRRLSASMGPRPCGRGWLPPL